MRLLGTADLDLLEAIMDPLSESPFFVKDADLRFVAANSAMARLCGVARSDELNGRRSDAFFPDAAARYYETLDAGVLATGQPFDDQLLHIAGRRAKHSWLLCRRTPIKDYDGNAVGIIGTARELHETKATARPLQRASATAEFIRENFSGRLDLPRLASKLEASTSQLNRDFTKYFGVSPKHFQQRIRFDHALQLLGGKESVAQIAQLCGYTDQSAFSRRFLQMTGKTPTQYRSLLKGHKVMGLPNQLVV